MTMAENHCARNNFIMLAEIYIEALLIDEVLADQVWELWNAGVITNDLAAWGWGILAASMGDS